MMTSIHELLKKEAEAVLNIPVSDAYVVYIPDTGSCESSFVFRF